jgi:hypothetical protein
MSLLMNANENKHHESERRNEQPFRPGLFSLLLRAASCTTINRKGVYTQQGEQSNIYWHTYTYTRHTYSHNRIMHFASCHYPLYILDSRVLCAPKRCGALSQRPRR